MTPEDQAQLVQSVLLESARLKQWLADHLAGEIVRAAELIIDSLRAGGKVMFCGNGGSAADSQHLAAELVGRYVRNGRALPALALTTDTSLLTAVANDFSYDDVFVRQVEGLSRAGDVLVGISTSGRSPNVLLVVQRAAELNVRTIGLLGGDGGPIAQAVEIPLIVPSRETARVQECHIAIGHILCELVEATLRV